MRFASPCLLVCLLFAFFVQPSFAQADSLGSRERVLEFADCRPDVDRPTPKACSIELLDKDGKTLASFREDAGRALVEKALDHYGDTLASANLYKEYGDQFLSKLGTTLWYGSVRAAWGVGAGLGLVYMLVEGVDALVGDKEYNWGYVLGVAAVGASVGFVLGGVVVGVMVFSQSPSIQFTVSF